MRETVSLEAPIGDTDASLGDFIEDEDTPQPDEIAADSMMKRDLRRILDSLPSASGGSSSCATGSPARSR